VDSLTDFIPEGLLKKLQLDFLMFVNDLRLFFYKKGFSEESQIEYLKFVVSFYGVIQDNILNEGEIKFFEGKEAEA